MDINIRKSIINNFKNEEIEGIKQSILVSLEKKDEITLPGLGVFFEILWETSNQEEQNHILRKLKDGLSNSPN